MGSHALHERRPAEDRFFEQHGFSRTPQLVQWMVTLRCPLSCPHCLADGSSEEMSPAERRAFIEEVASLGVPELLLTGGEPLAHPDLPDIVDLLRAHDVPWSLNTALVPDHRAQRAIEAHPPGFVAVSLDGPRELHDRFRGRPGQLDETLASIQYFAGLASTRVAAGTTVTRESLPYLARTFGVVLESGADQWGLHLPVPEGRAAFRPDLFLDHDQVERLISFAIAKRNYFPVVMADEIGFCGSREPLLRDTPFFCGAGRAGCVVLPDGEVVPCTTTDRSCSAGNVTTRPLSEIWRGGFAELRAWTPTGQCAGCADAERCRGGCWLQRRHGAHCFREVWREPRTRSAAGVALAVGLATAGVQMLPPRASAAARFPRQERSESQISKMEVLQRSIVTWYGSQVGGRRSLPEQTVLHTLKASLPADPGASYFLSFVSEKHPADLEGRAALIRRALETEQRSLCLIGLAWRDLTEWALDGPDPTKRSKADRLALRELMERLGHTAESWRRDVLRDKLDPFLRKPDAYRWFFMTKAGPPPSLRMERKLANKRGWAGPDPATEDFLDAHPHAEVMNLELEVTPGATIELLRAGETSAFTGELRVFDILRFRTHATLRIDVARTSLRIGVPAGVELLYADILRLFLQQNGAALEKLADTAARRGEPQQALALSLPLLRQRYAAAEAKAKAGEYNQELHNLTWWLADIYLF